MEVTGLSVAIFLCLIVTIYGWAKRKIPTRLDPSQAPKSRFGLVPADDNYRQPAPRHGVE